MNDLALQEQEAEPLDLVVAQTLGQRAERIRGLVDVVRGCIIETGCAKKKAGHGHWLDWLPGVRLAPDDSKPLRGRRGSVQIKHRA